MFKLSALNEKETSASDSDLHNNRKSTKEAQEVQAFNLYNEALQLQRDNQLDLAFNVYEQLLKTSLVTEAASTLVDENGEAIERPLKDPGLILKYSTHKNMASMSAERGDVDTAMEHYLQAVMLDTTDVTLWQRIGAHAVTLGRLALARHAFTSGLSCNENHWPCLDAAITVLYSLLDYESCLYWISKALEKDPEYTKGLVLRDKMFRECPHLRRDSQKLFRFCDFSIYDVEVDQDEAQQFFCCKTYNMYCRRFDGLGLGLTVFIWTLVPIFQMKTCIEEALELRERHRKLCVPKPLNDVAIKPPLNDLSWVKLGKCLISTYDYISTTKDNVSFRCKVIFENMDQLQCKLDGILKDSYSQVSSCSSKMSSANVSPAITKSLLVTGEVSEDSVDSILDMDTVPEASAPSTLCLAFDLPASTQDTVYSSQCSTQSNPCFSECTEAAPDTSVHSEVVNLLRQLVDEAATLSSSAKERSGIDPPLGDSSENFGFRSFCNVSDGFRNADIATSDAQEIANPSQRRTEACENVSTIPDQVRVVVNEMITAVASTAGDDLSEVDQEVFDVVQNLLEKISSQFSSDSTTLNESNFLQQDHLEGHLRVKRGPKRKKAMGDESEMPSKRRSTRVRTSTSKKREQVATFTSSPSIVADYKTRIVNLLPSVLVMSKKTSDEMSTVTDSRGEKTDQYRRVSSASAHYSVASQASDVLEFIRTNSGEPIIDLLQSFCFALSSKTHLKWESGTSRVLVDACARVQPHVTYAEMNELQDEAATRNARDALQSILNCVECQIDLSEKKTTPRQTCSFDELESHLLYLNSAVAFPDVFKMSESERALSSLDLKKFAMRLLWTRSKHLSMQGQNDSAIRDLGICRELLSAASRNDSNVGAEEKGYSLILPNLHHSPEISAKALEERLEILKRTQTLMDVKRLFENESYREVIELLRPTVSSTAKITSNPDRPHQIRQLMISFEKIGDHAAVASNVCNVVPEIVVNARCALPGSNAGHKPSQTSGEVSNVRSPDQKRFIKEWIATLQVVAQIADRSMAAASGAMEQVLAEDRAKLADAIAAAIDLVVNELDVGRTFPNKSNSAPVLFALWMMLYRLVKCEDSKVELHKIPLLTELPPSFALLDIAHQWMGERGMCCAAGGTLLKFVVNQFNERFKSWRRHLHPRLNDELTRMIEQCFYCMFAYPNKGKSRYLHDHTSKQLTPEWNDYLQIFGFFRPSRLPEFDSYKAITVSFELSQLITKALGDVPHSLLSQVPNSEDDVIAYIEADCDNTKRSLTQMSAGSDDVVVLGDMYYLLGDYFFKNNEMAKAVKYYLIDIRINPNRFDSWAGTALSRSSQTEDRLRLCENKKSPHKVKLSDGGTEKKGLAALSCFKRALSFDSSSAKLWIEYGSLAYWLHAMYSRQLKRKANRVSDDDRQVLTRKRQEMLRSARKCFEVVRQCDSDEVFGEEWLIDYMFGKLCEKEGKSMTVYIPHYQSASEILHRRHAKYPKKIQAKYGVGTELAIEALEMHFRVHASVLKHLEAHRVSAKGSCEAYFDVSDDDINNMKEIVDEMSKSPFVRREEHKSVASYATSQDDGSGARQEPTSKLAVVAESDDLTMGSLLPDSIVQALNLEMDEKPGPSADEDTETSQNSQSHTPTSTNKDLEETSQSVLISEGTATSAYSISSPGACAALEASNSKDNKRIFSAETPASYDPKRRQKDCDAIIDASESALRLCLRRFPQHIKAIYRLAHLYTYDDRKKNLGWARDILYGSTSPWQQKWHMSAPGLLTDRNKTNLFNGVWRIPMDDIDRPGSFAAHLCRCVALLINVLRELKENETLLHLHNMLNRAPDHGRKYLRDDDRIQLARRALIYCRAVLHRKILSLRTTQQKDCPAITSKRAAVGEPATSNEPKSPVSSSPLKGEAERDPNAPRLSQPFRNQSLYPNDRQAPGRAGPDILVRKGLSPPLGSNERSAVLSERPVAMTSVEAQGQLKSIEQINRSMDNNAGGDSPAVDESLQLVMSAFKVYQDTLKHPDSTTKVDSNQDESDVSHQRLLADAYHKYTCCVAKHSDGSGGTSDATNDNPLPELQIKATFERALKFCQSQLAQKKQAAAGSKATAPSPVMSSTAKLTGHVGTSDARHEQSTPSHEDAIRTDSGGATAAADHVKDLSIVDVAKEVADSTSNDVECRVNVGSSAAKAQVEAGHPKITIVQKEGKRYTRIEPPPRMTDADSSSGARAAADKDPVKSKRLRVDPGLRHLMNPTPTGLNGSTNKSRLQRSTSVPVTNARGFLDDPSADAENKPPYVHRAIYRTGSSVSDYTKTKLKNAILGRTSAALVRKPSITDQEMMQITGEFDADSSSQSEDEDEEMEEEIARAHKRKYPEDGSHPSSSASQSKPEAAFLERPEPVTSPLAAMQSSVITTVGST